MSFEQQSNVLHKVHKNVKFMVSQIRDIVRARHFLTKVSKKASTQRGNSSNISPNKVDVLLNHSHPESNLLDRYKFIRSKERPFIATIQSKQRPQRQKYKQTYQSHLIYGTTGKSPRNSESRANIHSKQEEQFSVKGQQNIRLPAIKNVRVQRYRNSLNNCYTMAIEDKEDQQKSLQKKAKTIESINDSSGQSKRRRFNSQLIRSEREKTQECIFRKNIKGFTYEPWENKEEENEVAF